MELAIAGINRKPHLLVNGVDKFDLSNGAGVSNSNKFLRALNTGLEIKFESFRQYNLLINNVNDVTK